MKKLLTLTASVFVGLMLSISVQAQEPLLAKMETSGANVQIIFEDFANAQGFESYDCYVDFGSWVGNIGTAVPVLIDNRTMYKCLDQGNILPGQYYDVFFSFEDRPYNRVSFSPVVKLKAN